MNLLKERLEFYSRRQKVNESVEDFATAIRRMAASCLFKNLDQSILRDHVLFGLKNKRILMQIVELGGDPTVNEVINLYIEFTNGNTKREQVPKRGRRSKRIKNKPTGKRI